MIVRDSAATLAGTLESLAGFDEVVVFDNGSTDESPAIAQRFANVSFHRGEFTGFGPTKNAAAKLARNDWVFSVDADERPDADMCAAIAAVDFSATRQVYAVGRENMFMGRQVRHSGWGRRWLVRLYNRTATGFNDAMVHENVQPVAGIPAQRLDGVLMHHAIRDIGQLLEKIHYYGDLRAREGKRKLYHPVLICLKTLWAFIRTYIFWGGFLDGWRGLVIAASDANGVFYKYMMMYSRHRAEIEAGGREMKTD